jgi:mannose-1-phosphate guanylyltransferase
MNESICSVEKFHEKPDIEKAKQYISEGYMWNAGIFLCQKSVYVREMKKYAPDILKMLTQNTNESYMSCPDISIDVGLMEKSTCRTVVRADIAWNDL